MPLRNILLTECIYIYDSEVCCRLDSEVCSLLDC